MHIRKGPKHRMDGNKKTNRRLVALVSLSADSFAIGIYITFTRGMTIDLELKSKPTSESAHISTADLGLGMVPKLNLGPSETAEILLSQPNFQHHF